MPKHRELIGKLLHTAEILLADAEQFIQSAQVDFEREPDWGHHHLLVKSNMSRILRLLSVGESAWIDTGHVSAQTAITVHG